MVRLLISGAYIIFFDLQNLGHHGNQLGQINIVPMVVAFFLKLLCLKCF